MKFNSLAIAAMVLPMPITAWAGAPDSSPTADEIAPAASATDTGVPAAANVGDPSGSPAPASNPSAAPTDQVSAPNAEATTVISSAPVPDTRENRRLYGRPLSQSGRATQPAGN